MSKPKTVKCRYKFCSHESREIPKEEAAKSGKAYYHTDCFIEMEEKKEVVALFLEKVNPFSPPAALWRIVNNIVHDKGVPSSLLLFGLEYYIAHRKKLNYPAGLYYVVGNKDVQNEYKKRSNLEKKIEFEVTEEVGTTFVYKNNKKSLDDLLKG